MHRRPGNQKVFDIARMVRKQIYIEPRQEVLLRQAAKRRKVSEAELIRLAIDRQLASGELQPLPPVLLPGNRPISLWWN
jgi:hypothetical protein